MLLEPRYQQIVEALRSQAVNDQHFERMAVALANDSGVVVRPVPGGTDFGFDGAISQPGSEPGPFVVTTRKDVIGNLTANLRRVHSERPHAAKIVAVATSRCLSERQQNNLRDRARELGFVLTDIFEEAAVAEFLYRNAEWSMTLLRISGELAPLSAFPLSRRPVHDVELLHRGDELERLKSASGDAMLVGPPGAGKTSILRNLAQSGCGLFLVTSDITRVVEALRRDVPPAIYVDDLDGSAGLCAELARVRKELRVGFSIVATAWAPDSQVTHVLGLTESQVHGLTQLSRPQMVDVVRAAGLQGPDFLVHDVVRQAEGLPGLAVSLALTCLRGGVMDVLTGDAIAREFYAALERLFGSRDEAALMLAAFALGGGQGMRMGPVSEFTGLSQVQMRSLLTQLLRNLAASGFVTPLRDDLVMVRPRRLRSVLIRDYLLQPPPLDVEPMLAEAPSRELATRELIAAVYAGAQVDRLREWVGVAPDAQVLAEFSALGAAESSWVLDTYPDRAAEVAQVALDLVPEQAIPALLSLSVGDERPKHSHPSHPMRLLADWVNEPPERFSAVERKRTLINATKGWLDRGGDAAVAFSALAAGFATEFRGTRVPPGDENQIVMSWGLYTQDDIGQLAVLWKDLVPYLASLADPAWTSLLDGLHGIAFPSAADEEKSKVSRTASRKLAAEMIRDIAEMAAADAAVVHRLHSLADRMGITLLVALDADYEALFGTGWRTKDWQKEEEQRTRELEVLAEAWGEKGPVWVAQRLVDLQAIAKRSGQGGMDRTPFVCQRIAEHASEPSRWLETTVEAGLPSACVYPFLEMAVASREDVPEAVMHAVLARDGLRPAAATLLLKGRIEDDAFVHEVLGFLPDYLGLIDLCAVREEIPQHVLLLLLTHPSLPVRQAAAIGSWKGEKHGFPHPDLQGAWREAILGAEVDDYWLGEILKTDSALAFDWLSRHQNESDSPLIFHGEFMSAATTALSDSQRVELLDGLQPSWRSEYMSALVGESTDVFTALLTMKHLDDHRLAPLSREPDSTWADFVDIAARRACSDRDLASASFGGSRSWWGPESKMWLELAGKFEVFKDDERPAVRRTASHCLEDLQGRIDNAVKRERHREVYGLDED